MTTPMTPRVDELVAEHVRSAMRVDPPLGLADEIIRAVTTLPQERRSLFVAMPALAPAMVAAVAAALLALALVFSAPSNVGPPQPTPTPVPTLTAEADRVLTAAGDVIRIPAMDAEGAFGTITIERGDEKGGYENFSPVAFGDVFFLELHVIYEPHRVTAEQYGEWEFAFAVDTDRDGFDADDVLQRGVGFLGMEGQPGYESAPQPLLAGKRSGADRLEGWLVLELPADVSDWDVYLVYGHNEWTDGIGNLEPEASALLREPGEPVGVSAFDPDAFPSPEGTAFAMPSLHALPSELPEPLPTFEPVVDADADALFDEVQTCRNADLGTTLTYPASWHTNEATDDFPACSLFGPEPVDADAFLSGFADVPVLVRKLEAWQGGIELPLYERIPIAGRTAWRISFTEEQMSFGTNYLIPTTDDPYGPFLAVVGFTDEGRAVLERMLTRLEIGE